MPLPSADNPGDRPRPTGEMVPVVEENGLVIGQATRQSVHDGSKLMHPVIHLTSSTGRGVCIFRNAR